MRIAVIVMVLGGLLLFPALASAHVTVNPSEVPEGGFARLDVRVPNEQDNAGTEKVQVEMPDGIAFASYEPVPGWDVDVRMEELDQPIEDHGEEITEQVDTVTFTAQGGNVIAPGQFQDFGLSVGVPGDAKEGDTLTFPAIQTYENGDVVRWIGPPDAEEPASEVAVTAPEEEHGAGGSEPAGEAENVSATTPAAATADDDGAPTWLVVVALALGAVGLLAGLAALVSSRRRSA